LREHRYITLWAAEGRGYSWCLTRAGQYSNDRIIAHLDYYNTGSNIAVPAAIVEILTRPGNPRGCDGVTLDMPVSEFLAVPDTNDV